MGKKAFLACCMHMKDREEEEVPKKVTRTNFLPLLLLSTSSTKNEINPD